ncbi:hypothetical protein CLV31_10797 [Algoriphagus aquaeductus]|uniref:Uncharacterized protein n=1 Tax=Algoriphagus aquaeductus TaxID=475299 RepID=A0A326RP02_9BACT|nr:hypothetical protein [Algoriphagus aquaeductus]PZV83145.1 hypothetical protein CLV31_10797 [Algoriphagus aquaeductus]
MKSFLFTVLLTWITTFSFAQSSFKNELTADHQRIPQTKVSLIPPNGFTLAKSYYGYEHKSSDSIIELIALGGPVEDIFEVMTPSELSKQGIEVYSRKPMRIGEYKALWIKGSEWSRGKKFGKHVIVIGNEKGCFLINSNYPARKPNIGEAIEESLKSLVFPSK